jgi:hypothetical protein
MVTELKLRAAAIASPRSVWIALLLVALLSVACASPRKTNQDMLLSMQAGDYSTAIAVLDEAREDAYGEKNEFLYHLERGMLLHYQGQHAESNLSFAAATRLSDELYTLQLSGELSTWMANDNARPYYGQNFERALVHMFSALNYQELGEPDSALVEIRQLNYLLRKMIVDGETNTYDDDAFAHYLAGIFFSESGEHDQAFVAYKMALDAYAAYPAKYGVGTPPSLRIDAARTAALLGGWAETELREKYGEFDFAPPPEGTGEVVVLHYNGRAPEKIDVFFDVAFGEGWGYVNQLRAENEDDEQVAKATGLVGAIAASEMIRVAYPEYKRIPKTIRSMTIQTATGKAAEAQLVESIGAIAEKDLADHIVRIRSKAIARAVVKFAIGKAAEEAAKQVGGNYGQLFGAVIKVGSAMIRNLSEVADKRAWFSVPEEIWLAKMDLAAGAYVLDIDYKDQHGDVVSSTQRSVTVAPGKRSVLMVRTSR